MAALACLGILSGLAVPNFLSAWPVYRLKAAARQIVSDMRHAQARSVARNREYRLVIDAASDSYRIEKGNLSGESSSWILETVRSVGTGETSGADIVEEIEKPVVIRPTGGMSNGTITLSNSRGNTIRIVFSMAGLIRMIRDS